MSVKTAGVGHIQLPAAPAAGVSITSGAANTYTTSAVAIGTTPSAVYVTGIHVEAAAALGGSYFSVQLMVGASAIGQYLVPLTTGSTVALGFRPIFPPIPVATATSITAKTAESAGSKAALVSLEIIAQSNVVDDGIAVTTVTTVTNQLTAAQVATGVWQDTTAGDFTTALSVGKSVMNGVALGTGLTINAYTGNTAQTGDAFARLGAPAGASVSADVAAAKADTAAVKASQVLATGTATAGAAATITLQTALGADSLPNGCIIAITGGTGIGQARVITGYVNSTKVTTVGHNWTTNPDATSVYYIVYNDAPKVDSNLKVAGVVLTDTVTTYTGNTVQTGDAFGRVGAAGAGLTALGDTRIANLDAAVTTRMATYTQPTGFLAASFPTSVASPTNITAGTITTVTNLTNAPTVGDLTSTMKTSVTTAATAATPIAASVTGAVGSVTSRVTANADQLAGQTITAAAGVTFPTSIASPTNITAGTITTVTNLTNAPTVGDLTATMKTSVTTAATAATPTAAAVTGAVGSVTGNIGGSVASVTAGVSVTTNNDKTGYTLAVTPPTAIAIRTEMDSNSTKLANLDATVSSRLASASYLGPDNTDIAAIKLKTDLIPASPAATGDAMTLTTGERTSIGTAVWASVARTLTAFGFTVPTTDATKVDELYKIQGLDAANPMTVTPTSRTSGAVTMDITGDGVTTTTVTRQ